MRIEAGVCESCKSVIESSNRLGLRSDVLDERLVKNDSILAITGASLRRRRAKPQKLDKIDQDMP